MLVSRRIKRTGQIGKLPIVIAVFALLEGVMAIVRLSSIFPLFRSTARLYTFEWSYAFENIFYFGAIWFFAIKYFETAQDLENMLKLSTSPGNIDDVANETSDSSSETVYLTP